MCLPVYPAKGFRGLPVPGNDTTPTQPWDGRPLEQAGPADPAAAPASSAQQGYGLAQAAWSQGGRREGGLSGGSFS